MREPEVLLDTATILAINKPAGWVVNDSKTAHGNPTVQDWVSKNFDFPLSQNTELRNGIVHRLDKETSGVLLIAKKDNVFHALQKQFADRETNKTYTALVHGKLVSGGTINAPIMRMPKNRTRFGVLPEGRPAKTVFQATKNFIYENKEYSLITLFPQTGRTHQLRVHMAYIHHPIVADPLYGGRSGVEKDKLISERMFLHAASLSFEDPVTGEEVTVDAPLPPDLTKTLSIIS